MVNQREYDDRLGPGSVGHDRPVVFRAAWPGKKEFLVGNFMIANDAGRDAQESRAREILRDFTARHLPDGCPPPDLIKIEPGALRWIPDDSEWRRA
jgi:hypothetical protein